MRGTALDRHRAALAAWRAIPHEEQIARMRAGPDPSGFAAAFPPRGPDDAGKVRVGVVSPCCFLGGAERWISDLLGHCDGSRVRWVGVATRDEAPAAGPGNLRADWEAHCPVAGGQAAIAALARSVDVLLTWGVVDLPWGIPPATLAGILPPGLPVVTVSHGSTEYDAHRVAAVLTDAIPVAVSRPALRGLPATKRAGARVIENGVAADRVEARRPRADVRAGWGVPPGAKVAGWLGRLSHEKRPDLFIDGIAALPAGWVGVMVGAGAHDARYRARAEAAAPGRVLFPGTTSDVGSALAAFDALAMTSDTEACSLAAAEAWLAGCPLVSTPVGMLEDRPDLARIVPRGGTGADVAAAILADVADPAGTIARIAHAQSFARLRLSMARFGREWTDLLCSVARPRVAPRRRAGSPAMDPTRLAMLAETCPAGSGPCGCGSGPPRECGHPDRPPLVRKADCLDCSARRWWASGVEAGW